MQNFVDKVTAKRQECADRGDTAMSATYKLVVNSSYGRLGMNLTKRVNTKYVHAKHLDKELKKAKFVRCQQVADESEMFEVVLKKARTTDSIPVQCCKFLILSLYLPEIYFNFQIIVVFSVPDLVQC